MFNSEMHRLLAAWCSLRSCCFNEKTSKKPTNQKQNNKKHPYILVTLMIPTFPFHKSSLKHLKMLNRQNFVVAVNHPSVLLFI